MKLNNRFITVIFFFFVLSIFAGEAHDNSPKVAENTKPKVPSDCAKEHIKASMEDTEARCKVFVKNEIDRRLQDPSVVAKDRKCLMSCFRGYHAAIASITKGVVDVSAALYIAAIQDVVAYSLAIAPCMTCSAGLVLTDPEFWAFQKWAKNRAGDLHTKLQSCKEE